MIINDNHVGPVEDMTLKPGQPYVIAVDFDDCLFTNAWPKVGEPIWTNIRKLQQRQKEKNAEIILWTCREGQELEDAIKACEKCGIRLSAVNVNLLYYAKGFGGDSRKIFAHEYWDDKAVNISPRNQLYSAVASTFGEKQFVKTVEELSELIQALSRLFLKDRFDLFNVAEEIVDVRIMLNQIECMLEDESQFREGMTFFDTFKHERLRHLIDSLKEEASKNGKD